MLSVQLLLEKNIADMKKTTLGDRMKGNYENRTRIYLPRRTNTICRIDGKAFHTFTRTFEKPFSSCLRGAMVHAMRECCKDIQGCKLGYHQSDEVSLWLTDYDNEQTEAFFDNNIQKIVSIISSTFTVHFNNYLSEVLGYRTLAIFDARVFSIPELSEVANYFLWRMRDCYTNSVSSVAQSQFSHSQLHGKNTSEMQEMLFQEKQINWSKFKSWQKNGSVCSKRKDIFDDINKGWSIEEVEKFSFDDVYNLLKETIGYD